MPTHGDDGVAAEIAAIEADFPGWRIWVSRGTDGAPCELMATRRRDLTFWELEAGLAPTLPNGLLGDLREQLAEQTRRERSVGSPQ